MTDDNIRLHSFRRLSPIRWVNVDHIVQIVQGVDVVNDGARRAVYSIQLTYGDGSQEATYYDTEEERSAVLQELLS